MNLGMECCELVVKMVCKFYYENGQFEWIIIIIFEGLFYGWLFVGIVVVGFEKMIKGFGFLLLGFLYLFWGDYEVLI